MQDNVSLTDFSGLRIRLASPEDILSWSKGEVTKPETINYRTFRPEKDGLFDEKIFGPTKDYECYCGKYKRIRYKGIICDRCGVEITESVVRRERMGHITLATPVAHIWYFKGSGAPISVLLDVPSQSLERIIYYALYLVLNVDKEKQKGILENLDKYKVDELKSLEDWYENEKIKTAKEFTKQKDNLNKRIVNPEQRGIALREVELKERESLKLLSDNYVDRKAHKIAFFDRIIKIVKNLKKNEVLEEDDYLFLEERNLTDGIEVGMGAEVIYNLLKSLDLKQAHTEVLNELARTKGDRRAKLLKKARLIESFLKGGTNPAWMIMTVLPVIPPDLRPVVQLPGGKIATSDLNDLYRRVINRNIRLKQFIDLGAPDIMLRNEKRMLQEAVDSLLDLQKAHGRMKTQGTTNIKVVRSLSDVIRGKQGRFRQNLLGKRVDYSGRSTIIVGPDLKLNQCGIPKEMALELFKPHILHKIIVRGLSPNIKGAKAFLEERSPVVYDILEEVTKDHPVLLNRAPTLHKLSILAFYPVLTDGYAIKLHPVVCAGYNADFDGDALGVFVPLSKASINEAKSRMLARDNLLKPSDGTPIAVPNKEMALGVYYTTSFDRTYDNKKDEDLKCYTSPQEALKAYNLNLVKLREPILISINKEIIRTSVGRVLLNEELPEEMRFINKEFKAADIKALVIQAIEYFGDNAKVADLIDRIKDLGFMGATLAGGLSVSVFDCNIIDDKDTIIKQAEAKIMEIEENYNQGFLTLNDKRRMSNKIWIETTENLATATWNSLDGENPVRLSIQSGGPRASKEQLKQISAMKGLVVDPMGKIIDVPTKSNYRQGLNVFEYVVAARGSRKGLTDTALKTADAGYLTRRLHDVAHDMIIRQDDCGTTEGLLISRNGDRGEKFKERIIGRFAACDVIGKDKKVIVKSGELIDKKAVEEIEADQISSVMVRSPLYCQARYGMCKKCYGQDMSTGHIVEIGVPVGVIAAQSIGEPGTQLTMRTKHFGGIVAADVTQGLPRVEELFETRIPKTVSPIAEITGKVNIVENEDEGIYQIKLIADNGDEQNFVVPFTQKLRIKDGDLVLKGTAISEGHLNISDVLSIKGLRDAQIYLVNEIQAIYESQGISIHDKHFEVIVRKMSDKVIIEDEGDTPFTQEEVVSQMVFEEENKKVLAYGGKPAIGRVCIFGITRAAIYTDSWLSAASFEQTTSVLSNAAINAKVDPLLGLKENVIIGGLIPVMEELMKRGGKSTRV